MKTPTIQAREERIAAARNLLASDQSKHVFGCLVLLFPEASVFWDDQEKAAELTAPGWTLSLTSL